MTPEPKKKSCDACGQRPAEIMGVPTASLSRAQCHALNVSPEMRPFVDLCEPCNSVAMVAT